MPRLPDFSQTVITTAAQPTPISKRLAPVILAMANAVYLGSLPATQAKYMSTAYSGSTAIKARSAIASDCGISNWASSAAQESMNAAPKMASPALKAWNSGGGGGPDRGIRIHW